MTQDEYIVQMIGKQALQIALLASQVDELQAEIETLSTKLESATSDAEQADASDGDAAEVTFDGGGMAVLNNHSSAIVSAPQL